MSKDEKSESDENKEEFSQMTFYITETTEMKLNFWFNELEKEHPELVYEKSRKRDLYEALMRTAMNNEDSFIDELEEIVG